MALLKKKTNFEEIKENNIDEMAEFLGEMVPCECCPVEVCSADSSIDCTTEMQKWLESEVQEDDG